MIFPSPKLIWVCSHFSAPKYARLNIGEGEGHVWVRTKVWRLNVRNLEKIQDKWLLFQWFATSIVVNWKVLVQSSLQSSSPAELHSKLKAWFLQATTRACNPNLQVVITHASHVRTQHSFGLPLRMSGMHKTQFDLEHFVIWSRVFWPSVTWNLRKARRWSKSVNWTSDHCGLHFLTFGYC